MRAGINSYRFGSAISEDPSDICTSLQVWLDQKTTDAKTGVAQEYATIVSSEITDLDDRSGEGNHVSAVTSREAQTDTLNSVRVIKSVTAGTGGVESTALITSSDPIGSSPFSLGMVASITPYGITKGAGVLFTIHEAGTLNNLIGLQIYTPSNVLRVYDYDGSFNGTSGTTVISGDEEIIITTTWEQTTGRVYVYLNGTLEITHETLGSYSTDLDTLRFGMNRDAGTPTYHDGILAEPVIDKAVWSTDQRQRMEAYYSSIYGITLD